MRTSLDSPTQGTTGRLDFQPLGGGWTDAGLEAGEPTLGAAAAGPSPVAETAHDFNNILSVILSCASDLAATDLDPHQREGIDEILAAASRGAVLTRELIDRGRRGGTPATVTPADIEAAIASVAPLLRRTAGPGVAVGLELDPGLPRALCDPDELGRALLNLVANARDAMPGGGELRIRADVATIGASDTTLGPGWYVRIAVTDTGAGMSPEVLGRVAEPYFSTKAERGNGLGLPAVFAAVRAVAGDVRISSVLGRGTTVALLLRAARADGTPLALGAR